MKIPLPIIEPATSVIASNSESSARSSCAGAGDAVSIGAIYQLRSAPRGVDLVCDSDIGSLRDRLSEGGQPDACQEKGKTGRTQIKRNFEGRSGSGRQAAQDHRDARRAAQARARREQAESKADRANKKGARRGAEGCQGLEGAIRQGSQNTCGSRGESCG